MDPTTHDAPTTPVATATATSTSSSPATTATTTTNARTPATRTVGFAIPKFEQSPGVVARDDGHVTRELKALRAAAEGGATAIGASSSAASSSAAGESNGIAIPSANGDAGDATTTTTTVGSREPVMIMPTRTKPSVVVLGGGAPMAAPEPSKGVNGDQDVEALTRELSLATTTKLGVSATTVKNAATGGDEAKDVAVGDATEKKGVKTQNAPPRDVPPPKPKMSKAERRELQEKQRAAKASAKDGDGGASGGGGAKKVEKSAGGGGDTAPASGGGHKGAAGGDKKSSAADASSKKKSDGRASTSSPRSVLGESVSHLRAVNKCYIPNASSLHPAVERLAVDYARGTTSGARERVYSLLRVLRSVVESFEVPSGTTYAHALTSHLNQVVHVLDKARPMGIAMGNAVRSLKTHLARMSHEEGQGGLGDEDYRGKTLMHIDYFIREKLDAALESIVKAGVGLIEPGDVIMTHGASQAVSAILIKAHASGVKFSVTIVDSRPSCEGAKILRNLSAHGIDCAFTALNGLSYAMKHATKVLVGAAACMGNGVVLSRVGSSAVAHAACARKIPVYVAAETCKFHERVQLDATVFNELGCDADVVRLRPGVEGVLASRPANLTIFNVTYDAIPARCVDAIVCEVGSIKPAEVLCYVLHS